MGEKAQAGGDRLGQTIIDLMPEADVTAGDRDGTVVFSNNQTGVVTRLIDQPAHRR